VTDETRSTPKGSAASACLLPVALSLLVLAGAASADGGWVLWEESNDLETFQRAATPRARASYTNLDDCIKAVDAALPAAWVTSEGQALPGWSRLTPTSAIVMVRDPHTNITYVFTYTCLPDTLLPPAPK
jgi:hypothetical protein